MPTMLDAPVIGATLFHSCAGGFPLHLCTYALLDENGNDAGSLDQVVVIRITALNGERFRLRDPAEIRRFLIAVGRLSDAEVLP